VSERNPKRHFRNLKILMVIPASQSDSTAMIFTRRQIDWIEKAGVQVLRFLLESRTSFTKLWYSLHALYKVQLQFRPDLVHAHYGAMTAFFSIIASKCPVIITFRGSDINGDKYNNWLHDQMSRLLSQISTLRAAGIICVSEELKRKLWFAHKRHISRVIPGGVDLNSFHPMCREVARTHLGWPLNGKVVLFNLGKGGRNKRIDLALAAIEEVKEQIRNIQFEVLKGDVKPNIIPFYLNAADALLLTSDNEGSPNIVKEAMACNLPVVSVDAGDVRERMDGVYPSMIVPRDPEMLGKALCQVLTSGLRSNGHYKIQELEAGRITKQMIKIYMSVLDQ